MREKQDSNQNSGGLKTVKKEKPAGFGLRFVEAQGHVFEMFLGIAIMAVVVMMVVPLTPWLIDILISINLGLSVLLIALAIFIKHPLSFTAFPTLLLIATLYRLALNVSSTRLILLKADAGRVIAGFGGVVVGGDILVGAVIFGILAMVLFLVITKGAERVAEVAARFTLDALPGMQLAIDSDLRSQAISSAEASKLRAKLDQRNRYYGSLDGAMKFVRGDAIAGLIIIFVNIAGGLAVGLLRKGMSIGQALDTYTRLTIGDGLVTMLPALLISTSAGLLVTRVGQGDDGRGLGEQIGLQVFAEPRSLLAAAICLIVLSIIPGLPFWPFALLGAAMTIGSVVQFRNERRKKLLAGEADFTMPSEDPARACAVVEVNDELYFDLSETASRQGGWRAVMRNITVPLRRDLGLLLGVIPIVKGGDSVPKDHVVLKIRGVPQIPTCVFWGDSQLTDEDRLDRFTAQVTKELMKKAGRLIGIDEAQALVEETAKHRPVLVRETVPKRIALPLLTELLCELANDGISLEHLTEMLEAISKTATLGDLDDLVQTVRNGLSPVITRRLLNSSGHIEAVVLSLDLEGVLESSLSKTTRGRRLVLDSEVTGQVIDACRKALGRAEQPVIITKSTLRRPLSFLFSADLPNVKVVSPQEIEPDIPVRVIGQIEI